MNNPYEAPSTESAIVEPKPYNQSLHTIAKGSWLTPLVCLGISMLLNSQRDPAMSIAGGFFFLGGILLGLIFAVIGLAMSAKYQRLLWHSLAGLLVSLLFVFLVIFMFVAIANLRQMNAQQQQGSIMLEELYF